MDVTFALSVIFTGVTIVFIVLVILIVVMILLGKLAGEKAQKKTGVAAVPEIRNSPVSMPAVKSAPKMSVEDGIGGETVAVIAAAVAAFTGGEGRIVSVCDTSERGAKKKDASHGRGAWSMAGLRENTQSF